MKTIALSVGTGGSGGTYRAVAVAEEVLANTEKSVVFLDEYNYEEYQDHALMHALRSGHLAEGHVVDLLREYPGRCSAISFKNTMAKASYKLTADECTSLANMHWVNAIEHARIKEGSFIIIDYILVNSNIDWVLERLETISELNLSILIIVDTLDTESIAFKRLEQYVSSITYGNIMPRDHHSKSCLRYVEFNNNLE